MNKTIKEVLEALEQNGKCTIQGFGTFYTKVQKGREGISAFNGKPYKTEDKIVIKFEQSGSLDSTNYPVK